MNLIRKEIVEVIGYQKITTKKGSTYYVLIAKVSFAGTGWIDRSFYTADALRKQVVEKGWYLS